MKRLSATHHGRGAGEATGELATQQ
jgi:hypothetical protein